MSKRKVPETSIEAHDSLSPEYLNDTYRVITKSLSEIGKGTVEDIAAHAKMDKHAVWKRMSELLKMEVIYRTEEKKVLKSGRKGFVWMLSEKYIIKTVVAQNALNPEKPKEEKIIEKTTSKYRSQKLF